MLFSRGIVALAGFQIAKLVLCGGKFRIGLDGLLQRGSLARGIAQFAQNDGEPVGKRGVARERGAGFAKQIGSFAIVSGLDRLFSLRRFQYGQRFVRFFL